jgi:serine protease Do
MSTVAAASGEKVRASVVGVRAGMGRGTGWVALPNGLIVTNGHVVGYNPHVVVHPAAGPRDIPAKVVYVDTRLDIAFLMPIFPLEIPPLPTVSATQAVPGQTVVAIGHPFGLSYTVTQGILSAHRTRRGVSYLQTDAALNAGNSGGPLLDIEGRVLGVNTMIHAAGQNLGFAVPVDAFRQDLERHAGAPASILALNPVYRCVECQVRYEPRDNRCLACGAPIRYAAELRDLATAQAFFQAERVVQEMIARLGFAPHRIRIAKGVWRLANETVDVWIYLYHDGEYVEFESRLCKLPRVGQEPFLRFLLTVNDKTSGPCRVALKKDIVTLSFAELTAFLNQAEVTATLGLLLAMSAELREVLQTTYGALPAPSGMDADADADAEDAP